MPANSVLWTVTDFGFLLYRKSSEWVAPPPGELVTTERLVRGEAAGTGPDLEASESARRKETAPGPTADHTE